MRGTIIGVVVFLVGTIISFGGLGPNTWQYWAVMLTVCAGFLLVAAGRR